MRAHILTPSGDTTGETDTSAFQAALDAERVRAAEATRRLLEIEPHFFDNLWSGKLAVDGREYQRRLRNRRKRRRR